jgi:hypothetical protein
MGVSCKWNRSLPVSGAEQDVSLLWRAKLMDSAESGVLSAGALCNQFGAMTCTIFNEF